MSTLHALLAGVDRYDPGRLATGIPIPPLSGAVHDVERMEAFLLAAPLSVPVERIRKLVSPAWAPDTAPPVPDDLPTCRNLVREIRGLAERAEPGDQVLIHYSGHGVRVPTALPELKGEAGWDECLVACDAGAPGAVGRGLLRDSEVHLLLRDLAVAGLQVCLVLDCCHSGGATRAIDHGKVRGLPDARLAVPERSLLGSWDELGTVLRGGASAPTAGEAALRSLASAGGRFPAPEGCVVLAACRANELAREYPFEGRPSGALTHFLLEATGELGIRPTYRELHRCLQARIRTRFEQQSPVLEGDGDLLFLGRERWPGLRSVGVLEVAGDPPAHVRLAAGRAQGVREGARFDIFPPGIRAEPQASVADLQAQVTRAEGTRSWAEITGSSAARVAPGWAAVLVDPGPQGLVRRVALEGAAESPTGARALHELGRALEAGDRAPFLTLGRDGDADFRVAVGTGGGFRIQDASGEDLPHVGPPLDAADPGALERLLERLGHLARFANVRDLDNLNLCSPLSGKLEIEVFGLGPGDDEGSGPRHPVDASALAVGDRIGISVRNLSDAALEIAILDLQPDWGISRAHPPPGQGDSVLVESGGETLAILDACLPDWMTEGRDVLRVLASRIPQDASWLELPPLGVPRDRTRSAREPTDPLGRLFVALAGERPATRSVRPAATAGDDWVVGRLELRMSRR